MILFEGMDKSGKTTLYKAFNEATNYKYLCCDRYYLSYIAYSIIRNKDIDIDYLIAELPSKVFIVYTAASDVSIFNRCRLANHEQINYEEAKEAFEEAVDIFVNEVSPGNSDVFVLELNTDLFTVEKCVEIILDEYEKFCNEVINDTLFMQIINTNYSNKENKK